MDAAEADGGKSKESQGNADVRRQGRREGGSTCSRVNRIKEQVQQADQRRWRWKGTTLLDGAHSPVDPAHVPHPTSPQSQVTTDPLGQSALGRLAGCTRRSMTHGRSRQRVRDDLSVQLLFNAAIPPLPFCPAATLSRFYAYDI